MRPTQRGLSLTTEISLQNFQQLLKPGQYLATSTVSMEVTSSIKDLLLNDLWNDPRAGKMIDQANAPSEEHPFRLDPTGLLLYKDLWYIPDANNLRLMITKQHHDFPTAGHPGQRKTLQLISKSYWWLNMKAFINHYILTCDLCSRTKARRHAPYGELKSVPVPPYPWTSVSTDLIEFLPLSKGYNSILVVVDHLTKMGIFIPTTANLTSKELAELYQRHVFAKYGLPLNIVSDRGSEFTSRFWRAFTQMLGIELHLSTAFHPETDGQTEQVN